MTFLAPIAALIAAGISIPALLALYFLKRRRRLVAISSTMLWRKAIEDLQVNAPFQRIRRNLLLLLQMLLLIGLLLAFARPTIGGRAEQGERTIIVIDHSASMNATDVKPSRLSYAKTLAMDLIDGVGEDVPEGGLTDGGGAMIISIAQRARVVQPFTTDRALLRRAVKSIVPTDQQSRLAPALQLIEPFALQQSSEQDRPLMVVHVISDGRMHDTAEKLTLRGAKLRFVRVGAKSQDNLAIVALAARRQVDQPQTVQVLVRLANYGTAQVQANLTLQVDGQVASVTAITVRPLLAAAPGSKAIQFDLHIPGAALIAISHDHDDDLDVDNRGYLSIAPQRPLRVVLISEQGNAFLTRALKATGAELLQRRNPAAYEARLQANDAVDVLVFDRYSPSAMPPVASLYFDAAPPVPGLKLLHDQPKPSPGKADVPQSVLDWRRDHPVLRYVALDDLILSQPGRLTLPDTAQMLAAAQIGPVMAAIEIGGRRHVVVGFDLLQTNWPMQISFPVFVDNALQWLGQGWQSTAGPSFRPGDVAVIPAPPGPPGSGDATKLTYRGPVPLGGDVFDGRAVLSMFTRAGLYRANGNVPEPWDKLAVNLNDARESDLRPAERLEVGTEAATAVAAESTVGRRQVWRWFIWAALAMLMIEWFVYTRRVGL